METWKQVVGFEGKYEVSDLGMVKSMNYRGNTKEVKALKPYPKGKYLKLSLVSAKSKVLTRHVHKLVADAFLGPSNGLVIDHINGNGFDNRLRNLRYVTSRENVSCENVKRKKPKASKYPGVSYNANSNGKKKWRSILAHNKIKYSLGTFWTEEEARDAYLAKLKSITA
jgi:hypothetical protein